MLDRQIFFYSQYILEISLLDASFLRFLPSQLAAASLILSAKQLKKINIWTKEMEAATGYARNQLKEVVREVKLFVFEINPKFIAILKYKFSKPQYLNVSSLKVEF